MDADLGKVIAYDPAEFGDEPLSLPADIGLVTNAVKQVNAKLVIIDPAAAVIGCNANNDKSVRDALRPLAKLATERDAAVVIVRHLHKTAGTSLLYRGAGSIAWVATARSGLLATNDPGSPDTYAHILVQTKTNLVGAKTISYRTKLIGGAGEVGVEWGAETAITARDLTGGPDLEHSKFREALEVLYQILAEGPRTAEAVRKKGDFSLDATGRQSLKLLELRRGFC